MRKCTKQPTSSSVVRELTSTDRADQVVKHADLIDFCVVNKGIKPYRNQVVALVHLHQQGEVVKQTMPGTRCAPDKCTTVSYSVPIAEKAGSASTLSATCTVDTPITKAETTARKST